MEKNKNFNTKEIRDDSRFTRWINNLDEKDKSLSPMIRKSKWVLITAIVFFLFGISFIWMPGIRVNMGVAESLVVNGDSIQNSATSTFEIPVDSFENRLKQKLHEELP